MRSLLLFAALFLAAHALLKGAEFEVDPDQELSVGSNHNNEQQESRARELAAESDPALLRSAALGDSEAVLRALQSDPEAVRAQTATGWTAVHYATANDFPELLTTLVRHGADVNQAEHDSWTPLMFAAFQGKEHIARQLIDLGADLLRANAQGLTAFDLAVSQRHDALGAFLGAQSLLQAIGQEGRMDAILQLVRKGVDANTHSGQGWTPLIYAAASGARDAAEELLSLGADVNKAENDGWTPLLFAANNGHADIVQLLLERGANIDAASHTLQSAFTLAYDRGFREVAEVLNVFQERLRDEMDRLEAESRFEAPPHPKQDKKKKKKGMLGLWD